MFYIKQRILGWMSAKSPASNTLLANLAYLDNEDAKKQAEKNQFNPLNSAVKSYQDLMQSLSLDDWHAGAYALKRLKKASRYVERNHGKHYDIFTLLLSKMNAKAYDEIIDIYDQTFSQDDWQKARAYFEKNSDQTYCGQNEAMMYSYIKTNNGIFRRNLTLGAGHYGRTKVGIEETGSRSVAIKRQHGRNSPELMQREALINLDLGVAQSDLTIRRNWDGGVYKYYQSMFNLGCSLKKVLAEGINDNERLGYAIQLLQKVIELHSGAASLSKKRYAHRDIKPANIMVDQSGGLHLIDFGLTIDSGLDLQHSPRAGTNCYMPRDLNDPQTIMATPSYLFDDKIATLRTIMHPNESIQSILRPQQLPDFLAAMLDTSDISKCISQNDTHTLPAILDSLTAYQAVNLVLVL